MAYVYYIKNKETNQYYYGSRSKDSTGDFWIKYFTSSVYVKRLIQEHSADSFECKILFEYDDHDVCYWYEQLLIRETFRHENSLNKTFIDPDTGNSKFATIGPKSESTKFKMREAKTRYFSNEDNKRAYRERVQRLHHEGRFLYKRTPEMTLAASKRTTEIMSDLKMIQQLREKRLEYLSVPENLQATRDHLCNLNKSRIGISLTQEHRDNISEGSKSRGSVTEETRQRLSIALKGKPKSEVAKEAFRDGWEKRKANGKDGNNPFKEKVACPHCGKMGQVTCMKRWHFDNCKLKLSNLPLPSVT